MTYRVEVEFQEFGWTALNEAAQRQGVTVQELLQHAAMYYLVHADPEPMSHKIPSADIEQLSGGPF